MLPEPPLVTPLEPWQTVWPVALALILALWGAWGLRREMRPGKALWILLAVALAVRCLWLPIGAHEFDGHEAEYLDLLLGDRALTRGGPLLVPAMQWTAWGLGKIMPFPAALTGLALGFGLLSIGAWVGILSRLADERLGLVAGALLAFWGTHAFWSSSAYNVVHPHALGAVSLWALVVLVQGGPPRASGALAGGAAALAIAFRVELVLLAPVGLIWLVLYRPPHWRRWLPPLLGGAAIGTTAAALMLYPGEVPGSGERGMSWWANRGLFVYFAPFSTLWLLALPGLGLAVGLRRWPRAFLPIALLVPLVHGLGATFDDYGFRHALTALPALAAGLAALITVRWGLPILAGAAVLLALHTGDVANRYYASESRFAQSLDPDLPEWSLDALEHCALICEDGRILPEDRQRSHFNLLDAAEAESLRAEKGCLFWLVGFQDHRWSSRAVRDRRLRVEHLYETEVRAVVKDPDTDYVGLVIQVGTRRSGTTPSAPGVQQPTGKSPGRP
jgi:hypothetical protein